MSDEQGKVVEVTRDDGEVVRIKVSQTGYFTVRDAGDLIVVPDQYSNSVASAMFARGTWSIAIFEGSKAI